MNILPQMDIRKCPLFNNNKKKWTYFFVWRKSESNILENNYASGIWQGLIDMQLYSKTKNLPKGRFHKRGPDPESFALLTLRGRQDFPDKSGSTPA
jgi:hypothetical protein